MTVTEPNITSPVEEAQPQKTSRWAAWRGMWFFPVAVLWMELVLRISTIGFDADDVAAVQKADGVVAAAGSVNADFIWQHDNKERVYRAHMLTDNINEPVLTAGRMPENGSECLIDSSRFSEDMIGQTIEISDSNDEDTKKNFKYSTYTVVGLADSPLYIHTLRGTTSLGNGTLQGFVLIPEDGFDFEYYTESVSYTHLRAHET